MRMGTDTAGAEQDGGERRRIACVSRFGSSGAWDGPVYKNRPVRSQFLGLALQVPRTHGLVVLD